MFYIILHYNDVRKHVYLLCINRKYYNIINVVKNTQVKIMSK